MKLQSKYFSDYEKLLSWCNQTLNLDYIVSITSTASTDFSGYRVFYKQ